MVLLTKSANNGVGNAGFDQKVELFKKSEFILTSQLSGDANWTLESIVKRQGQLAELAVKAWPVI